MTELPDGDWRPDADRPGWLRDPGRPGYLLSADGRHWRADADTPPAIHAARAAEDADARIASPRVLVDLAGVLGAVETLLRRFIVFASAHQVVALTLWIAHTHATEAAETTPYLHISSPVKRTGKSRVFDVIEHVVRAPLLAANVSEAALYRSIQLRRPTLLFDEVDAIFAPKAARESLRGILNAGHRRGRPVLRMGGPRMTEVETFDTFCPKALAGIGSLPDTVADRSIPIRLVRRKASEPIERLRLRSIKIDAQPLYQQLAAWAVEDGVIDRLSSARPELPEINDRAAEGWEPLFAIADEAGGDWPARARAAAVALSGGTDVDEGIRTRLLADIRTVFEGARVERLATARIVGALVDIEDGPWAEKWARALRDDPTHKAVGSALARMLRDFGIKPRKIRIGEGTVNGYERTQFEDVWERYVPERSALSSPRERNNGTLQVKSGVGAGDVDGEHPLENGSDQARSVVPFLHRERPAPTRERAMPGEPSMPSRVADEAIAASMIAEERARGRPDEAIAELLDTAGVPPPHDFKGWTGYAVRVAESRDA